MSATPNPLSTSKLRRSRYAPGETHCQADPVIAGCATEHGFTRVRQYHCPSPQHPSWMHRPEIHTPDGGYGFRARSFHSRPEMTGVRFCGRDQLLISADQVFSISLTTESGIGM